MFVLILAALFELSGCYAMWLWVREGRSAWWAAGGLMALAIFGYVLARSPAPMAGRTFAAYGGVYLTAAFGWYVLFERARPDRWDVAGVLLGVLGACIVLYAPR
jgi:small multidrug resistance family-3 protein